MNSVSVNEINDRLAGKKGKCMEKKADFKKMSRSEKAGFIWDYYKWWMIGGIIVTAFAVNLIYHFATYKAPVAEMVLVNCSNYGMDETKEPDFADFMDKYGYDKKKQEVVLQTSYVVDLTNTSSSNAYAYEALQTQIAAGGVDVLAADEAVYIYLAKQQDMANLSDYLPDKLMEKYAGDIVYITDEETGEKYPAGIRLLNNEWIDRYGFYPDGCVIGIINGSSREAAAEKLLFYVMGED